MKKKNWDILFNYAKMIFNIRKVKHRLKDLEAMSNTINSQQKIINMYKTVWNKLISNEENMPMAIEAFKSLSFNSSDIALVQSYLFYLFKNFDEICRKNGLKYWFRGGSLLGVVRHGGFIPWDDDIDIGMMRDDMYKLQELLENSDFSIVYHFNNTKRESICRIPRFVNKNNGINIFIDIFPFDYTRFKEKEALKNYLAKRDFLYDEISTMVKNGEIQEYQGFMYEDNTKDLPALNQVFDNITEREQEVTENIIYPFDWFDTTQNLYYKTSDIFPLKEMPFGDMQVYVPNDFVLALNMCYDNFLELPTGFMDHKDCHKLLSNKRHVRKFLLRERIRQN